MFSEVWLRALYEVFEDGAICTMGCVLSSTVCTEDWLFALMMMVLLTTLGTHCVVLAPFGNVPKLLTLVAAYSFDCFLWCADIVMVQDVETFCDE